MRTIDKNSVFGRVLLVNISLPPELERVIREKVESGRYSDASEVIGEALRQSTDRETENECLKREAAIGFAQLEAGETVSVDDREGFIALARREL